MVRSKDRLELPIFCSRKMSNDGFLCHETWFTCLAIRGVQIRSDSFGFRNQNIHIGSD